MVASQATLSERLALQRLHHPALFSGSRHRTFKSRTQPARLLQRRKGHYRHSTVQVTESNLNIPNSQDTPTYILAWTTTPWTLPSNTALCVGPKIDYVAVKGTNPYTEEQAIYILAQARLSAYFQAEEGKELEILWQGKGTDLVGTKYEQLFPWVKPSAIENGKVVDKSQEGFRVIPGDYVTTEDGTGIVHIAPTFGADDAKVAKDAGIPSLFIIDKAGDTRPMVDFTGKYFLKEDMDETFRQICVNEETYSIHEGDYVKNAYDPKFN